MKRKIGKTLLALLATLGIAAVTVIGVQAPAQATHIYPCNDGLACVYSGTDSTPRLSISYSGSGGIGVCNNMDPLGWNDANIREYNGFGSGLRIQFYRDHNCTNSNNSFILCNGCLRTHSLINIYYKELSSWKILSA